MRMRGLGLAVLATLLAWGCGDQGGSDGTGTTLGETGESGDGDGDGDGEGNFGPEETYDLRLNDEEPPPLNLEMNKEEVAELFGDSAADIDLLEVDSTPLLINQLEEIVNACGTDWQKDKEDPVYDCDLTPLGQTFEGWDGTWKTSPEFSFVRILTITPANSDVSGTSIEGLAEMSDLLGIGGGYAQILSEALGIPRTQAVIDIPALVPALQQNFIESHPNVDDGTVLPVTLEDALTDMASLGDKYGPVGDHPGVIADDFPVHGEVFGPNFKMTAIADSNLRLVDGVGMATGKDYLSVIVDVTGPTFDDEVEFDFTDPQKFSLEGLIENLTIDMKFAVQEHPDFVDSCTGNPCKTNLPGAPQNASSVWAIDPWLVEFSIAAGGHIKYKARTFYEEYGLGLAKISIGQNGDPAGWTHYDIFLDLGSPPEDQFIWETINEVAQVRLHDNQFANFPEGSANVEFTLFDIPVGLTGAEAAEKVRPALQDQASKLSDILLGDFKKNNGDIDFYYRRGSNGAPYLFFVSEDDLRDDQTWDYTKPGFFDSSDLSADSKVSSTDINGLGDTAHEKYKLPEGETVLYAQGADGNTYRLRFEVGSDISEITVHVAAKE
jgi:hypothetical protein